MAFLPALIPGRPSSKAGARKNLDFGFRVQCIRDGGLRVQAKGSRFRL